MCASRRETTPPPPPIATRARAMLLLFETPAGYSLFKVKDEKKLQDAEVRATRLDRGTREREGRANENAKARDDRRGGGGTRDAGRRGRRAATRDAREGSRGRSWTRDGATGDADGARAVGGRDSFDSRGNWRIGDWRANAREDEGERTRGRGRD